MAQKWGKANTFLLGLIALLLGALIFVVAIKNNDPMDNMAGHMGHSSSSGSLTGADVMFLQMMIPHHQQAVDMSTLALEKSSNAQLRDLATRIKSAQTSEIAQMRKWLSDAGADEDPGHSMSGMGGMLSTKEFAALKSATGTTFDRLWLEGMIGHHDGAIHMTNMIEDADNPEIKAFGKNVVKVQSAEIKEMQGILNSVKYSN